MEDRSGSYALGPRLDVQQLQMEAQHRWLRPAEICEILCNYQKFHIASEPPDKPLSGSLFLFDRKVLRYFRKDGHNWRKKKDGKTVREAHEKLKVGSVDVLHCYYAHGEENENFQRRCYWMLDQDLMHIVFVHYLEVKGSKTNVEGTRETNEVVSNPGKHSSLTFGFPGNHTKAAIGIMDSVSPTSTLTSSCEDADSGYDADSHQARSRSHSYFELPQIGNAPTSENMNSGLSYYSLLSPSSGLPPDSPEVQSSVPGDHVSHVGVRPRDSCDSYFTLESQRTLGLGSWEDVLEHCTRGSDNVPSHDNMESILQKENTIHGELLASETAVKEDSGSSLPVQLNWQIAFTDNSSSLSKRTMDLSTDLGSAYDLGAGFFEQRIYDDLQSALEPFSTFLDQKNELLVQNNLQMQLSDVKSQGQMKSSCDGEMHKESHMNYAFSVKQKLFGEEGNLEKVDSFSRWMSKVLEEVDNLQMQSSGIPWSIVECGNVVDDSSLSPALSHDQLFSIIDFSPKRAYTNLEIEVVVIGMFLKSPQELAKCKWSCMFAEMEVPAEVLADGVLCCRTPPHTVGRVPFYITCSNRLACSEVREFEYLVDSVNDIDISDIYGSSKSELLLHLRFERLVSMRSPRNHLYEGLCEKRNLICKLIQLKDEEECYQMVEATSEKNLSQHFEKELILQKMMTEKLYSWLVRKVTEDGKGPSILDDEGQGVLHLAASLGYDWALKPTVTAGVSINFRDVNGWTALHWAAFCGREKTVAVLVSLGAAPGALTDPSPEFPLSRTPADLASSNGHKGISGFLAESSLTSLLSSLQMNDSTEDGALEYSTATAVQTISERTAIPGNDTDVADVLSLKDSLTAVCNATQAADRIHQIFRMQSFQRKQLSDSGDEEIAMSYEHALSHLAAKTRRHERGDGIAHSAAIQIQKKFRGWKKRKEFLLIRQRIVKIQAHVRGHQARKKYRPIIWSVGILEKVILRWRRKGSGLRGFRRDALNKNPDEQNIPLNEDDYDFLKEGRKQTEKRLQKALGRVKSMVQYPEARAQYRRLLNGVEGSRETKGSESSDMILNGLDEIAADVDVDLIDIDSLLDDDNFMSTPFE